MAHVSATNTTNSSTDDKKLFAISNIGKTVCIKMRHCYVCSFKRFEICDLRFAICDLQTGLHNRHGWFLFVIVFAFSVIGSSLEMLYQENRTHIYSFVSFFSECIGTVFSAYFCIACCWNTWKITHNFLAELRLRNWREKKQTRWHSKDEYASAHNNNNGIQCVRVRVPYGMSIWYDFVTMFAHKCPNTSFVQFFFSSSFFCIDFIYVSFFFVSRPTSHVRIQLCAHWARQIFTISQERPHGFWTTHTWGILLWCHKTPYEMLPYIFIDVHFTLAML